MDLFKKNLSKKMNSNFDDLVSLMNGSLDSFADWPLDKTNKDFVPAINIKEKEDHYLIEAELAGIKKDQIDINVKDNALILKGEKKTFNEDNKGDYYYMERSFGNFYRTIPLGQDADFEKVSAEFNDGVLIIDVAKHTENHPKSSRKITIK